MTSFMDDTAKKSWYKKASNAAITSFAYHVLKDELYQKIGKRQKKRERK